MMELANKIAAKGCILLIFVSCMAKRATFEPCWKANRSGARRGLVVNDLPLTVAKQVRQPHLLKVADNLPFQFLSLDTPFPAEPIGRSV
jgi:hypothetical protein